MSRYTSLSDLLDELSPDLPASGPGWDDVLIRADALAAGSNGSPGQVRRFELRGVGERRRWRRNRSTIALALVALVGLVVAATYALGHPIINFGKAPKSSRTVVNLFGRLTVIATPTDVLPHEARSITVVRIDGVDHRLSVAPVKTGGFCYAWSGGLFGSCQTATPPPGTAGLNWTPEPGGLLWMGIPGKSQTLSVIGGSFLARSATRLILRYKDGKSDQVPFVWVTAPINAGFFLFAVPEAHQKRSDPPTSITLLDSANHQIETQTMSPLPAVPPTKRSYHLKRRYPEGYAPVSVPVQAEWPQRRQLLRFTTDGVRTGLWVAPERGGGTCFWTYGISACSTPSQPLRPPAGTLWLRVKRVSHYVVVCCTVARNVQRVVAHFQDGDRTVLKVTDGFVLWPIPKRHYAPGHRLNELVGYSKSGAEVGIAQPSPNIRELYPCTKPKNYGYGLVMCP